MWLYFEIARATLIIKQCSLRHRHRRQPQKEEQLYLAEIAFSKGEVLPLAGRSLYRLQQGARDVSGTQH
jgi:hypothetical protein